MPHHSMVLSSVLRLAVAVLCFSQHAQSFSTLVFAPCLNRPIAYAPTTTTAARRQVLHARPRQRSSSSNHGKRYQSSVGLDTGSAPPSSSTSKLRVANTEELIPMDVGDVQPVEVAGLENKSELRDLTTTIFNGVLLATCFGFAAYTILNIDHGMTRGWSQSEIAMRIPLDNWLNYESSLADRPIFTKTAINVIIYLLGDWLSQTAFSGKNVLDFDAWRTLRNGFIGLCFGPIVHEYYQFSDHILPVEGGMWNRLEKIVMDQTLYLTVKCAVYISAVGLLQGDSVQTVKTNVQTKLPNIVVTAWKFWPLIHLVTYGLIPARHRILWVNCVDLVWNGILASMAQKGVDEEDVVVSTSESSESELEDMGMGLESKFDDPLLESTTILQIATNDTSDVLSVQEDPFLLHQDVVALELSESLFEEPQASNWTNAQDSPLIRYRSEPGRHEL